MKAGPFTAALVATAVITGYSAHAQTIDLRDCPLDTVVFTDPWAGGSFTVKRVGTNYNWLCADGFQPPDEMCQGPYGDLVLDGEYRSDANAAPEQKMAIYTIIKGVPCCDWSVESGNSPVIKNEDFKWLEAAKTPLLREMPFLSIESEHAEDFGNPYFAAACTLRK
jgi:hypothetical protein